MFSGGAREISIAVRDGHISHRPRETCKDFDGTLQSAACNHQADDIVEVGFHCLPCLRISDGKLILLVNWLHAP